MGRSSVSDTDTAPHAMDSACGSAPRKGFTQRARRAAEFSKGQRSVVRFTRRQQRIGTQDVSKREFGRSHDRRLPEHSAHGDIAVQLSIATPQSAASRPDRFGPRISAPFAVLRALCVNPSRRSLNRRGMLHRPSASSAFPASSARNTPGSARLPLTRERCHTSVRSAPCYGAVVCRVTGETHPASCRASAAARRSSVSTPICTRPVAVSSGSVMKR